MATPYKSANEYFDTQTDLSPKVFYNVALQLLHFEVNLDFQLSNPFKALKKIRLPHVKVNPSSPLTSDEIFKAWYVLLNIRTKRGQTYFDELASDGYYHQFNDLPKPLFIRGWLL